MPGSSPNCARGPPGMRFRTVKPMIETITSSTMLCTRRLSRNPDIRVTMLVLQYHSRAGLGHRALAGSTSARPIPGQRIPGFGARIAVRHEAVDPLLETFDRVVLIQRQEWQIATHEFLYAEVDRAPR